jgi:KTSC domain
MNSRTLTILLISLAGASWTDTETVDVKNRGTVDLKQFACQDTPRSSLVNRVCYDAANRSMIVQVNAVYFQHCEVPQAMLDTFLNAPSMGQYYRSKIASAGSNGSYDCPAYRASKHSRWQQFRWANSLSS